MRTPVERRDTGAPVTVRVLMSNLILAAVLKGRGFSRAVNLHKINCGSGRHVRPAPAENEFHFQDAPMLS